jgi:hypothetical protein
MTRIGALGAAGVLIGAASPMSKMVVLDITNDNTPSS